MRVRRMSLPSDTSFRSLRFRLLGPLIAVAVLAATLVAFASYRLGARWAMADVRERLRGIEDALADSTFPLGATVLDSVADLTQTDLVSIGPSERLQHSTIRNLRSVPQKSQLSLDGKHYLVFSFPTVRGAGRADQVTGVAVLFDEQTLAASRRRAAVLPLATGLSTILALSSITLFIQSRLVRRIASLQRRVGAIAAGHFQSPASDHNAEAADELGRLGAAVDQMARQLDQLWKQVHRQQGEKLLHRIASGMAHQLRNSLTGARMAVEMHAAECGDAEDECLQVAIHQIEISEDYVRRLLLVGSGQQDQDRPAEIDICWDDVRSSLMPIAKHWNVKIQWEMDETIRETGARAARRVQDGPTWVAAVTNLAHNALQAGDQVHVRLDRPDADTVRVRVRDNGRGIEGSIAGQLFEPFMTTKPEGLGLGLPLVRRAAESLGGEVHWRREDRYTVFEFSARLIAAENTLSDGPTGSD